MIEEITAKEFDEFALNHELSNYHQSSAYATLMTKFGYDKVYIAYKVNGKIKAASLLLLKKIKYIFKYAYAPKGFLIDYKNKKLLNDFTKKIKEYAKNNKIIFIKINPEIPTYRIYNNFKKRKLSNLEIIDTLTSLDYVKLKDNLYFESLIPRFNAIVDLKNYSIRNIDKTNRNKIHSAVRKGLEIEVFNENKVKELYPFIERKKRRRNINYYKNYFNVFDDNKSVDIFLVKINYEKYLENSTLVYEKELEVNKKLTEKLFNKNSQENITRKMNSDTKLLSYKNDVINATYGISKDPNKYIAGALCIKYQNHVHIVISGYNKIYGGLNPNYFLHNEIIKYYKDNFDYLDLNGLTGDFSKQNPYKGLNDFKIGFNPLIYEFIGEFDLVVDKRFYDLLLTTGLIQKEFKKD